ncbi:MAG: hypothetical protein RMK45_04570 [Armatimonadota bacterium]|nr:hypothetical protein [Armatimonadota bacterium]
MKGLSMFAKVSIGLTLTIVVAAAIFLLGIRPALQNIAYYRENIQQLEAKVAQIPRAQRLVQRAQERVRQAERDLARIERTKMPKNTIDLSDRLKAWMQYPDMVREIGIKLRVWPERTGVQRLYEVNLPPPPNDPNAIPTLALVFPIGQVQVRAASFESLLNHVRKWNEVPNLVVLVDGLAIQGMSPELYGSYTLTVFVYPRLSKGQVGPNVPSSPQQATGTTPALGGFGAGVGMPGGPGAGGFGGPGI